MARRMPMICDICGKEGVHTRRVTRSYGKHKKLLVIENVPVVSCSRCGESYITAKLNRQSFATKRPISVANFT